MPYLAIKLGGGNDEREPEIKYETAKPRKERKPKVTYLFDPADLDITHIFLRPWATIGCRLASV